MKTTISHLKTLSCIAASCSLLGAGLVHAKEGKEKGNGKNNGGPAGHSDKGKGGGKDKGNNFDKDQGKAEKAFRKDMDKDNKNFEKDFKEARKEVEKDDKEFAKWREKRFRDNDRDGVLRYFSDYRDTEYGLPPGLAKNLNRGKPLPPGWRNKVSRGYVIEDDYQDYFYPLENDLFPGMEVIPDTRLYRYGDRIVRVYEPRREVIDMIVIPTIRGLLGG